MHLAPPNPASHNQASHANPVSDPTTTDLPHNRAHRANSGSKVASVMAASALRCKACGSHRHSTKNCHVPASGGAVVICPFHDCSARDGQKPAGHTLDGLAHSNARYCPLVTIYRAAHRMNDRGRLRYMLPQMFGELVLGRKRKPCCRVFNAELCPIRIAIEFSRAFCNGQMPSGLQGVWPYTKRDVMRHAIRSKLGQYDTLGWEGMPPGELEGKSWEQIKREYALGLIPPQIQYVSKVRAQRILAFAARSAAAEQTTKKFEPRSADTGLELYPSAEQGDHDYSLEKGNKIRPGKRKKEKEKKKKYVGMKDFRRLRAKVERVAKTKKMKKKQHVRMKDFWKLRAKVEGVAKTMGEMQQLPARVDNLLDTLEAWGTREMGYQPAPKAVSRADGTRDAPIDVDMYG
ncbi:hypothetical protein KVR01_012016 [Diaporthe batatas]|uniref:uncharacterized protein n=1 Tax=Diaporthe batatas TaxID=748121 RepID=UPI001D057D23|nr:uncharacterized protein KVR01_012016 [Diaporthe batatas]KAG8158255.1 hypothetical protein KVR01_012016 [Diaporthe batatas]